MRRLLLLLLLLLLLALLALPLAALGALLLLLALLPLPLFAHLVARRRAPTQAAVKHHLDPPEAARRLRPLGTTAPSVCPETAGHVNARRLVQTVRRLGRPSGREPHHTAHHGVARGGETTADGGWVQV